MFLHTDTATFGSTIAIVYPILFFFIITIIFRKLNKNVDLIISLIAVFWRIGLISLAK